MQIRSILTAIFALSCLTGCGTYSAVSGAVWLATERTATDWAMSGLTGADCRTQHLVQDKYVCEQPVVYNQSGID
jgi:hypothetical protein